MAKNKNTLLYIIILLWFFQRSNAQQCVQFVPQPYYDCITELSYTSYTLAGGSAPYTYTIVNAVNNATMASGFITSVPSGTIAPLPQGNFNVYIESATPNCSMTLLGYIINVNFAVSNPVVPAANMASVTCFGANNGSAAVIPPASFNANPGYTWMPTGVNTPTISNMIAGVIYSVTIRDSKGCETKTTVTVSEPPPINSTLASTHITCYGQTLNTVITSTGNVGATTYTVNAMSVLQNNAIGLMAGVQTIITRDSKGCVKTNTVLVDQGAQPLVAFYKVSPNCPGGADGGITAIVSNVPPAFVYVWQPGNFNGANLVNVSAGTYTLNLSYDNGACSTATVTSLAPAVSPTITALTNPENCSAADGAYTLTVNGVNGPFSYTTLPFGGQAGNIRSNLSSGTYKVLTGYNFNINTNSYCVDTSLVNIGNLSTVSVSVQNSTPILCNGSCNASVTLNVTNAVVPVTYSASGNPTSSVNSFANLCAGSYTIRAVDANGCPATTTINFVAPPPLSFTPAVNSTSVCAGQAANLQAGATGGTGNYTFIWKPGNFQGQVINLIPSGTTVYSLNAYDANGCTAAAKQITITVAAPLSININSSSSGICPGTTAQITPTVSGGDGMYSYNWMPGNTTGASIFVQNITVPVYTLVVKDGCGSPKATKLITINLFPATKPEFVSDGLKGCEPFCTRFLNKTPKSSNAVWNFGDGQTARVGDTLSYCYTRDGRFNITLSVIDSNFCVASYCYTNAVQVMNSPTSNFNTNPNYITFTTAENVLFKNLTEDAVKYQWYVSDYYYGTDKDISFTFRDTGCYKVVLISESVNGCSDSLVKYVCVNEDFNFYMPNCFTPDGDGRNDVLIPKGTGWSDTDYLFEIYDRWGQRLFTTSDPKGAWDGIKAKEDTPFGVYVWKIKVTDIKGTEHKFVGSVTMVR